jgi:Sec-independent protein translocase protein TatA
MEFLGIGPLEFFFILIIVLLVFSPKDIGRGARTIGRSLNRLYRSENYKVIQRASEELRDLPNRLAREAHLEELDKLKQETEHEIRAASNELRDTQAAAIRNPPADKPFQAWVEETPSNQIAPPVAPPAADSDSAPPSDVSG